jgi:4-hydroxy-4-methyl-2-oxoglutarate aldolase
MQDLVASEAALSEKKIFDKIESCLYAAAFSDILDELGFRDQAVDPRSGIRPLAPGSVMIGRACTLLNRRDNDPHEPYKLAIEALDGVTMGQVIIAAGDTPLEAGIFGELSATRVTTCGGRGALIDGFTRDGRKLIEMQFPVFCRGVSPIDTTGRVRVVDYNIPLQIGNRTVAPGQIVFADMDGVILIPREAEEEVLAKALERAAVETQVREELQAGDTMDSVWKKYHVL